MQKEFVGLFVCMLLMANALAILEAKEFSSTTEHITSLVFSEPMLNERDQYITLTVAEATSSHMDPGRPLLPCVTKTFTFPFGTTITSVECTPLQIDQLSIPGEIQPSPEPILISDTGNEQGTPSGAYPYKDAAVYGSTEFYPGSWFEYSTGCGLHDGNHVVIVSVRVYPTRYSPGQHLIQFAPAMDIKVTSDEPPQPVEFTDAYDMVIISPSEFVSQLRPLADYKNDSSVITKLVRLDDIYNGVYFPVNGRDDPEKIKYFIKDAIEAWNISYVLLAGGSTMVPVRMSYVQDGEETSFISDLYYADIYDAYGEFSSWDSNGNGIYGENNYQGRTDLVDLYPDVYVGRLCFNGPDDVSPVVTKIVTYESSGAYMEAWFHNFVVCGGDTFQDYEGIDEGEYLNSHAIQMMDGFADEKIWVTNGKLQFIANIDNALLNGSGFMYMTGHGTFDTWATHPHNDFDTWWPVGLYWYFRAEMLKNAEKLPVVVIGGCSNSQFIEDHCVGWSFVKNPDGGGIASYGNTALGWGFLGSGCTQGLTGAMEMSAFNAYGIQHAKTTGELWERALTTYRTTYFFNSGVDYKTMEEWVLFADPSVHIAQVSGKPQSPGSITGPTSGEIDISYNYTVSATDPDGDGIKYCFDWDDQTVTWTERVASGQSVVVSHAWEKPGIYDVRVKVRDIYGLDSEWSAPLKVTIISSGPFLEVTSVRGGLLNIRAVIKNVGSLPAENVTCSITVQGGLLGLISVESEGSLGNFNVSEEKTATAGVILGFGKINISVTATSPTANTATREATGFVLGPLLIVRRDTTPLVFSFLSFDKNTLSQ